jgi:hypothetical protein
VGQDAKEMDICIIGFVCGKSKSWGNCLRGYLIVYRPHRAFLLKQIHHASAHEY